MSDFANKLNQIQMGMPSNTMQIRDIKSRKLFESGSNNLLAKSDVKFCGHGDQPTGQERHCNLTNHWFSIESQLVPPF